MRDERSLRDELSRKNEIDLGNLGEAVWKSLFAYCDVKYISLCDIVERRPHRIGGAPMLQGQQPIVLPDFDVSNGQRGAYVDSKVKTMAVLYRNAGELRHGINLDSYRAYLAIGHERRQKAMLGVIELFTDDGTGKPGDWSGSFLMQSLATLGVPCPRGGEEKPPKVYWPRGKFVVLASRVQARDLIAAKNGPQFLCPSLRECKAELFNLIGRPEPPTQRALF